MTALGLASSNASQKIVAGRIQVAVFTAALFFSAALLFGIQPMFTKMVLPRFGGSPSLKGGAPGPKYLLTLTLRDSLECNEAVQP